MAQIFDFQLSAKQYVDLALKKHREGDIIAAARYARKAIDADKRSISAYGVLSLLFADEGEFELSNKTIFRAMFETGKWNDVELRRQLAVNYMNLDMPDVAMYYVDDVDADMYDAIECAMQDSENESAYSELYLSYPRGEKYYERIIARAFEKAHLGDVDGALDMLDTIPDGFCEDTKEHAYLMLLTVKNDPDALVERVEKLLAASPDSTSLKCALATAYIIKEREKEAKEIIEPLFGRDDLDLETAFMILPVAINLDRHGEIVRIIRLIEEKNSKKSMRLMLWLAQALYNIGEPQEARKVLASLCDFYGDESPAGYYLKCIADKPKRLEYSLSLPIEAVSEYAKTAAKLISMDEDELDKFEAKHSLVCDNLEYYVHWLLGSRFKELKHAVGARLLLDKRGDRLMKLCLVSGDLSYEVLSSIIYALAYCNDGLHPFEFDIVAQERYKHIRFFLPRAFQLLPNVLKTAVQLGMADIVFTDEDPNFYLERFVALINSIVNISIEGGLVYAKKQYERLANVRNADALVGVFLGKVYEEDETRESIIERYGLNAKLYDKYYKIVFGEVDDE